MNSVDFDKEVESVLQQVRDILVIKGKEYRRNDNPFHNFDVGARIKNISREKVLDGMLLKHEISISDMTNDLDEYKLPSRETLNEKFIDNIVYLILKKASILDRIIIMETEIDIDEEGKRKQVSTNIKK